MKNIVSVFKAMSDETRVKILLLLAHKDVCAKGIAKQINISEAAVSQHIKVLKQSNLITGYKDGYYIMYHINKEVFQLSKNFLTSLINEDLENHIQKLEIQEFNILNCNTNCKSIKKCCRKNSGRNNIMKVCIPVQENKGMESIPFNHFGSAPTFVICDLDSNEVISIGNGDLGHEHGKCQPIKALSGEVVDAVIAAGIGQGAISKLNSMGIKVYKACEGDVFANLQMLKEGKLNEFPTNHSCNHDGCSHH